MIPTHVSPAEVEWPLPKQLKASRRVAKRLSQRVGKLRLHVADLNPITRTPARIEVKDAPLRRRKDLVYAGHYWMTTLRKLFGFSHRELVEFSGDPRVIRDSSNHQIVYLQQLCHGRPIPGMIRNLVFSPKDRLRAIYGNNHPLRKAPAQRLPTFGSPTAAQRAAEMLLAAGESPEQAGASRFSRPSRAALLKLSRNSPEVESVFPHPPRPNMLRAPAPLESLGASLVYQPLDGELALAWAVVFGLPEGDGEFRVIIACDERADGRMLAVEEISARAGVRGWIHAVPEDPDAAPQASAPSPTDFPEEWFGSDTVTSGPYVISTRASKAVDVSVLAADRLDQAVINSFYFGNLMHGFFASLGFDEAAGNFAARNGCRCDDPMKVKFINRKHAGLYKHRPDGESPFMELGRLWIDGMPSAFDSDLVVHEYAHGVTARLVGGPGSVDQFSTNQSRGLAEGWSDYFALSYHNYMNPDTPNFVWAGRGIPEHERPNLRRFHRYPRDYDPASRQGRHFGQLASLPSTHLLYRIGEIWCSFLLDLHLAFTRHGGFADERAAQRFTWELIIDALKGRTPVNPTLLDARRAMDEVLKLRGSGQRITRCRRVLWATCCCHQMGVHASSAAGIVPDQTMPSGLATPNGFRCPAG